ncbi:uncharacterized protein LOC126739647 [Anthonomus grandis grandis]|uniref:uncharacterized protein LOC126739647 n=1 Tax=Anthonomus grandis grandis TaxID=2921223 RepID=UPI002166B550|nr:uncharacterized protein LOC126739647 [Anthonomus grandis grandis]
MGGSPSKTRKLTVENNDPNNVIQLSEDVVDRIRGVTQTVRNEEALHTPVSPVVSPIQPPAGLPVYMYEPSLTSLQLRQANVAELKKNDDYWQNRIKSMEESHKTINEVLDKEYKKALEEFKTGKPAQNLKEIPCLESKKAVMKCYRENCDQPMKCAKIVQAFQECVDYKRTCLLASRVSANKG